ncbi:DUF1998 domain-containing protein [Herpetosiphon giganteus]|uniref:DUF1998 domain-containing protein n=1 Tax=Herpetosiphon giganteus TaxID=2029754 RepID=UPI00195E206B|nr:DUF1998 domain-containing protein [Herpetosiphon giganteus]MBM7845675.1 hypothetical protein [Herpetosiphon giganteus]
MNNPNLSVGDIRPSQVVQSFGIGSLIDLPHLSVMVLGLDDWVVDSRSEVSEARLLAAVQAELGSQVQRLMHPPVETTASSGMVYSGTPLVGVPVATFPRWMVCPLCRQLLAIESSLVQLKTDPVRPDRARYVHANCSKAKAPPTMVPARFLAGCEHGHLDDFPWSYFVHGQQVGCAGVLRILEAGVTGEAAEIYIECDGCHHGTAGKSRRPLSDAFGEKALTSLPACRGRHPHVRMFSDEPCLKPLKTLALGASNTWFGVMASALSLPQAVDPVAKIVEEHWLQFNRATSINDLEMMRRFNVIPPYPTITDAAFWAAIEARRQGQSIENPKSLKTPEWQTLRQPLQAPSSGHFRAVPTGVPEGMAGMIQQVVLVERLREVRALLGFTRIRAFGDLEETTSDDQAMVGLSRGKPTWVPATDVYGEGIFLEFDEAAIQRWCQRAAVQLRQRQFQAAHRTWRSQRRLDPNQGYPDIRYTLLHSLAHALIRQLAVACGYAMASLRERIYALEPTADDGPMAGILIYTAAADSEGTLGGLVQLGQPDTLGYHLRAALETLQICASDPLCADHEPQTEPGLLHGAACHACLFLPETSCERGNKYLDRSLVIATVERTDLAFFEE